MTDVVDEVLRLTEELESKRRGAIEALLAQRAEVLKEIDEKLSRLGYKAGGGDGETGRKKRGPMSEEHKQKIREARMRNKAEREAGEKEPRLVKKGKGV